MATPIPSLVSKITPQERAAQADEDKALLSQVASKDLRAFEVLYRNYYRRLTRFLERITRQAYLVEEVLDDTMLVVWLKAHTYDGSCRVSTWIFAIAYNKAMKAIRRVGRPADTLSDNEMAGTNNNGPETESIDRETR